MKENVIIINRLPSSTYYKNDTPIIDNNKYNVFIISKPYLFNMIDSKDYYRLYEIDINNQILVLDIVNNINLMFKINYVIALSESDQLIAGKIRSMYDIKGLKYDEALLFRDKFKMKSKLKEFNISLPKFSELKNAKESYDLVVSKCIVKPKLGTGSKDIYIINNKNELDELYCKLEGHINEYEIEEFIEGNVYHCDSIVKNGNIELCNIMKYSEPPLLFYQRNMRYSIIEDDLNLRSHIFKFNYDVIKSLNLINGVTHHEMIINDKGKITFCEIASRPGGSGVVPSIEQTHSINLREAAIKLEINECLPKIKETNVLSSWMVFITHSGRIVKMPSESDFKDNWIKYCKFNYHCGDNIIEAKYCSDAIAIFVIIAENKSDLLDRIDIVKNKFINLFVQK